MIYILKSYTIEQESQFLSKITRDSCVRMALLLTYWLLLCYHSAVVLPRTMLLANRPHIHSYLLSETDLNRSDRRF